MKELRVIFKDHSYFKNFKSNFVILLSHVKDTIKFCYFSFGT